VLTSVNNLISIGHRIFAILGARNLDIENQPIVNVLLNGSLTQECSYNINNSKNYNHKWKSQKYYCLQFALTEVYKKKKPNLSNKNSQKIRKHYIYKYFKSFQAIIETKN
jgi:hypothetical protein